MMKAFAPLGLIIVAIIAIGLLAATGILPLGSIIGGDLTCQPGRMIKPQYGVYTCEQSPNMVDEAMPYYYTCAPYYCYDIACYSGPAKASGSSCQFWVTSNNPIISPSATLNDAGLCKYGRPCGISIADNQKVTIVINPTIGVVPSAIKKYYPTGLAYENKQTGQEAFIGKGCGLTASNIGLDYYNKLPVVNKNKVLAWHEVLNTIVGWNDYPLAGNVITYQNQSVECRNDGIYRSLWSLDKYDGGLNNCYYYEKQQLTTVECCPGDVRADGAACSNALKWTTVPQQGGCCPAGFCSDLYCPGAGGYDWQPWLPGKQVCKYGCNAVTATCGATDCKTANCNPFTNTGCMTGQFCDATDWTCKMQPATTKLCTEAGFECCLPGMFSWIRDTRTCEQAGKIGYTCLNGYCYPPGPVETCNHDGVCQPATGETTVTCPSDCGKDWMATLTWFVIAFVVILIALLVLWLVTPLKLILKSPKILVAAAILLAAAATLLTMQA